MLLAIDLGNSNVTLGLFDDGGPGPSGPTPMTPTEGPRLTHRLRLETIRTRTSDEYAVLVRQLLLLHGIPHDRVQAAVLASVVPTLTDTMTRLVRTAFGIETLVVGPGIKTGIAVAVDNPREVGADRIVNAVAAHDRLVRRREAAGRGIIVVDFGTATTFDVVSPKGEYLGGVICPGVHISADALFARTAKLPRVEVARPPRALGKNTQHAMQSGLFFGYAAMVDGLVARLRGELGFPTSCLATGGLAQVIAPATTTIDEVDEDLTLVGLRILHERNQA